MTRLSTVGVFIRDSLIEAGPRGLVVADLFRQFKDLERTKATYCSFARYFWLYKRLGYVEETGEREPAWNPELKERTYFRITPDGLARTWEWGNPLAQVMGRDEWQEYMREWRTHRPSSGQGPGGPRKSE
jgi:hypothetical protein